MAYRGTAESMDEEIQLMRGLVTQHGVTFSVGVSEDERLQAIYGANGLPTVALIDSQSIVRYTGAGVGDSGFDEALENCLAEVGEE